MCFIAALATALWKVLPQLELLLAGPLFALALYQRYAYRSVLAKRDAETDGLTLLRNHRAFQADIQEALGATDGEPVALAMLDIDDFKSINDQFGHPVGDEVLQLGRPRRCASELGGERCYRVGGEEFAVLMPGAGRRRRGAADRPAARTPGAHRLRRTARRSASAPASPSYPEMADTRGELVRVADSALYWAKNHGKGRSCLYTPQHRAHPVAPGDRGGGRAPRPAPRRRGADPRRRREGQLHRRALPGRQRARRRASARTSASTRRRLEQLRLAGLLHDLGKVAIPDSILQKSGRARRRGGDRAARASRDRLPAARGRRRGAGARVGAAPPRGVGRQRLPARAEGRRDPARLADHPRRRRVSRDDVRPALPAGAASVHDALAELRRCCWTQFDARIVAALEEHLAELERQQAEAV